MWFEFYSVILLQLILQSFCVLAQPCQLPNVTPDTFSETAFDYVIIGSGPGGLPLATRLSEDPGVKVGVIEAGFLHLDDPLVNVPAFQGESEGNLAYDWNFTSTPQPSAAGRQVPQPRGKIVGGSTGINLMAWDRASRREYDAWQNFAGSGWNFDGLLPYFQKVESLSTARNNPYPGISRSAATAANLSFTHEDGFSGPINISYNAMYTDIVFPLVKSYNNLSIETNADPYGGDTVGIRNERANTAIKKGIRSYAANGYYCPNSERTNLVILTFAQATKVVLSNNTIDGLHQATGVEFVVNGTSFAVNASREVVLSAGTFQTPQLLELSGIGNSSILSNFGIQTIINLPGVGENLQDQLYVPSQSLLVDGMLTFDKLRNDPGFLQEQQAIYTQNGSGWLAATDSALAFVSLQSFLSKSAIVNLTRTLNSTLFNKNLSPLQKKSYPIQLTWLTDDSIPQIEIIALSKGLIAPANGSSYLSMLSGGMHPFGRGSVHINSSDPTAAPTIDPQYLTHDFDVQILELAVKLATKVTSQDPISSLISAQQFPPPSSNNSEIEDWVRETSASGSHPVGTAAMAPRSIGGVVDARLLVYGTSNLRVVDASIIPLHIAAHSQSTIYAISEKAADLIRGLRL